MDKDTSSINQHLKSQRIGWTIKRISWIGMALILLYGLLGGFGDSDGILNEKTIHLPGIKIEYEKLLRVQKSLEMKVIIEEAVVNDLSISINKDYIDKVQVTQIIPEPAQVEVTDDLIIYNFSSFKKGSIRMKKSRIQVDDILEAARKAHGLESLEEIKSVILEKDGPLNVVPNYKDKLVSAL